MIKDIIIIIYFNVIVGLVMRRITYVCMSSYVKQVRWPQFIYESIYDEHNNVPRLYNSASFKLAQNVKSCISIHQKKEGETLTWVRDWNPSKMVLSCHKSPKWPSSKIHYWYSILLHMSLTDFKVRIQKRWRSKSIKRNVNKHFTKSICNISCQH